MINSAIIYMATGTIPQTKSARLYLNISPPAGSVLRGYTMGTTVTVSDLAKRPYDRAVLVVGHWAGTNSLMLMPTPVIIPANSQQITVSSMWNTQTDSRQTSGQWDIRIIDLDFV